jgi:hypothetical protein
MSMPPTGRPGPPAASFVELRERVDGARHRAREATRARPRVDDLEQFGSTLLERLDAALLARSRA